MLRAPEKEGLKGSFFHSAFALFLQQLQGGGRGRGRGVTRAQWDLKRSFFVKKLKRIDFGGRYVDKDIITNLGQEAAKEVSFKLKAESFDKASEFRGRTAVILARETAHLKSRILKKDVV